MVADTGELEILDASEICAGRLNGKEVLTPKNGQNFMFTVADGTVKYEAKSIKMIFEGESDGSQP